MNNFGRVALAISLGAALTFTNPEFFQAETGITVVYAEQEEAKTPEGSDSDSSEAGSTTEIQEKTTEEKAATEASSESTGSEETSETTESSSDQTESSAEATTQGNAENGTQSSEASDSTAEETTDSGNGKTEKKKKTVSSRESSEIKTDSVKDIKNELASEDAPDGSDKTKTVIPKIYNDTRLAMKNNKEYIAGYVYFNQGDSAWNQNGYCIAKAGCGPTSMAVVITSLTGEWVTPLDTAIWGYQHGYYSSAGSAHAMIPAMAAAYGIDCEGVGTDYQAIRKALKAGKPVVALMGPGYFTRGGHFMVLVAIDENDCVTVADVGSRARSAYKYRLSDIISQSKAASAGGPFWVMSYDKKSEKKEKKKTIKNYTKQDIKEAFADSMYVNLEGGLPSSLTKTGEAKVTVKKVVSVLTASSENSILGGTFTPMEKKTAVVYEKASDTDSERAGSAVGGQNLSGIIKQDIAKREWEQRISLSRLENYMKGTIEK